MKLRKIQALALAMVMTLGAFAMPAYADSKTATTAIKAAPRRQTISTHANPNLPHEKQP